MISQFHSSFSVKKPFDETLQQITKNHPRPMNIDAQGCYFKDFDVYDKLFLIEGYNPRGK